MDESGTIQAQPLGCIKICVAAIKLLRLKSLTFWGHLNRGVFILLVVKLFEMIVLMVVVSYYMKRIDVNYCGCLESHLT